MKEQRKQEPPWNMRDLTYSRMHCGFSQELPPVHSQHSAALLCRVDSATRSLHLLAPGPCVGSSSPRLERCRLRWVLIDAVLTVVSYRFSSKPNLPDDNSRGPCACQ